MSGWWINEWRSLCWRDVALLSVHVVRGYVSVCVLGVGFGVSW